MKYGDPHGQSLGKPTQHCSIDGCASAARTKSSELCAKHYHRSYRHGNVNARYNEMKTAPPSKYRTEYKPQHPLATKHGTVYVHRRVLFDRVGPGPHSCHWCKREVDWSLALGAGDYLQVDHLDEDKGNNEPNNLVPSCGRCNTTRSTQKRNELVRSLGGWSKNDTVAALKDPYQRRSTMEFSVG